MHTDEQQNGVKVQTYVHRFVFVFLPFWVYIADEDLFSYVL